MSKTVKITGLTTAGVFKVTPIQRPVGSTGRWHYDPYMYATVTTSSTGQTVEFEIR